MKILYYCVWSKKKNHCLDAVKMNEHYNKYSVKMIYVTLYYNIYIFFTLLQFYTRVSWD